MDQYAFIKQQDCKARESKMITLLSTFQPGEMADGLVGAKIDEQEVFLKVASKLKVIFFLRVQIIYLDYYKRMMVFNKIPPPLDLRFDINSSLYIQEVENSQNKFFEISEKFQTCLSNPNLLDIPQCSEHFLTNSKVLIETLNTKLQQFFLF